VQLERPGVDRIRGGAVEADADDPALDETAGRLGVRIGPAGPVVVVPPVPAIVGAEEEPVALVEVAQ
jgi:hypothetical protein